MPEIRPMRDLRDTNTISRLCHTTAEPVFITKNGRQDLVIMSNEEFERRCAREEIYAKLLEAEGDAARGNLLARKGYRALTIRKKYEAAYRVSEAQREVVVQRIFYGRREYGKLL